MYEPYFPPPGKPQDDYGHISLPLAIIVTNQNFGFPSQRPVYLQVEECVRKLLYCLCTQLSVLSYTIVTYYWQTLLTQPVITMV